MENSARQAGGEEKRRYEIALALCLVLIVTFIAFYPSLSNGFTNWDDEAMVTDNWMIKNLSGETVIRFFTTIHQNLYQPIVLLSFSIEYYFFKLDPRPYHTTNLILHLLNCALVFWLILLLSGNAHVACLTALLFGVHPLRVQSVAWVVERKDLLFSFFFLLSFISYIYYREKAGMKYYGLSLGLFLLSLLSKVMGAMLPLALLLYDALYQKKLDRAAFLEKIPYFLLSLAIVLVTIPQQANKSLMPCILHNIIVAAYIVFLYIAKILALVGLSFFYQYPASLKAHIPPLLSIFPFLVLALLWALYAARRYSRTVTFGGFFFLITIFPVIQIIPIIGYEIIAERFTYIPSIGVLYILSEAFFRLYERQGRALRILLTIVLVVIIGLSSVITWQRCAIWKDSLTFWNDTLKRNPDTAVAHNNRGTYYFDKKEYQKALQDYNEALRISPHYAAAYHNRGALYFEIKDDARALADFNEALMLKPSCPAYSNRGFLFTLTGNHDRALDDYRHALELDPFNPEVYNNRGVTYYAKKDYDKAIDDFNRALKLAPGFFRAYTNRALAYCMTKDYDRAWEDVSKLHALGQQVDPEFLARLRKDSGRSE
jgi:protein O-mannosyl-transferase